MKQDDLYRELIRLAEQLGIHVSEQNLRISGLPVQSGLCRVHQEKKYIMDKRLPIRIKLKLITGIVATPLLEGDWFLVPAVRAYLEKQRKHTARTTQRV